MRIGFAGLGRMGALMTQRLCAHGHKLVVWNRTTDKARALATELGCELADTPKQLSELSDIVLTMLADDHSSECVHNGPDGLFAGTAKLYVEMGTHSPDHIHSLASQVPLGTRIIDAPVSGATQAARAGQLMIMAGCTSDEATPLKPLFDAMGKQTIYLGKLGAGAVMKLAVNSMIHGINQTLAEAMTLAEASGIDRETAFDVIEASAACAPMLKYRRPLYLDEDAHEVSFTVALALKDMAVITTLAKQLGVAMPQSKVTLDKLRDAHDAGYASRDMASILDFMRRETL